MNANQFKEIIKKIVAEEVKREVANQLPKLLFEMLSQKPKTVVREAVAPQTKVVYKGQPLQRNPADDPEEGPISRPDPQPKVIKRYVKDPKLNAVLNETTPGLPVTPYGSGVDIGVPDFEKVGVSEEFMGEMRQLMSEGIPSSSPQPQQDVIEEAPTVGPNLSKMFNKNFKAILDKSKGKTGGSFGGMIQNW